MKRLLKISFDLSLMSFIPILSWFFLSIIIDKNLINIFSLMYPIQFIFYILKSIFATGANISREKDKNKNATMSGIVAGSIVGFIVFGILVLNIEHYISFMNMDIKVYKTFAIYSSILFYIQLLFQFVLCKLYYENKNTLANKYSIQFNFISFISLILFAILFKNQVIIVINSLLLVFIYTTIIIFKSMNSFKFQMNILKFIKYDSTELFNNLMFFLIFLFGLSNALNYGENFTLALTFTSLITDTQWDIIDAIVTASQIDISKNDFNYKKHLKNAYKLLILLLLTILIMFLILYNFYTLSLSITLIFLSFELINFLIYPIYKLKTCYLQLEYSAFKTTFNKITASSFRMLISLLKTPYCTGIGQVFSSIYQFITINLMFHKHYYISKDGYINKI